MAKIAKRAAPAWVLLLFAFLTIVAWTLPLWLSVTTAFKSPTDLVTTELYELPSSFYLQNIIDFWRDSDFGRKLWNSIFISATACLITVTLSFFNAVALGLGNLKYRSALITAAIIAFAIPQEAFAFPTYKMAKLLGLYGEQLPLIVMLGIIYSAFGTFLLAEVMRTFPRELVEAAHLDGANMWQTIRHVVYPIMKPTMQTLVALVFIWNWNEYMLPLILLPGNDSQTLPIAILQTFVQPSFTSTPNIAWGAAGIVLSSAPTILFFLLFQRALARGVTIGIR